MTTVKIQVGPRNARTDPESGLRYYHWQGRDLPSVTSIRRMAGIPFGLHAWSINEVIDHAIEQAWVTAERLNENRSEEEIKSEVALLRHEYRAASTAKRDKAAELGTAVHDAAAAGRLLEEVDEELRPRLAQYLDWLRTSKAAIIAAEFQVFNLEVGYAGSVDLLCQLQDGSVWLVDLKTGKGIYSEHNLQVAAYAHAEFVGADDVVDEWLTGWLKDVTRTAVLHLSDDGWEFIVLPDDNGAWEAFQGLLAFSLWTRDHADPGSFTEAVRTGTATPEKVPA